MRFLRPPRTAFDDALAPGSARPTPPPPPALAPPEPAEPIRVSRTLVMSKPELAELIRSEPRLQVDGVRISLIEKGFGTRVAIDAHPRSRLGAEEMEVILNELAEPQKRPFSAG